MTADALRDAPLAHLQLDARGVVLHANRGSSAVFDRPAHTLPGKPFEALFPPGPEGRGKVRAVLEARFANAEEVALDVGAETARWARLFAWSTPGAERETHRLEVLVTDVSEHRRVVRALEESEARFRVLGDSAPVLLWMSGPDGRCTFFNQRWLEFTGRTMDDELGEGWAEGIHPEDFQHAMDTYFDAFVRRRSFRMEYRLLRADGQYRWILDTGLPRSAGGSFAGYIGSCIDVTDLREANEALARLKRQLEGRVEQSESAIEARDEFLSIASHELRTPLSALVLQLSGIQHLMQGAGTVPHDRMTHKLDRAVRVTDRLAGLVDSLLDVSRITAGALRLEPEICDLADVVPKVVDGFVDSAARAGCVLRRRVDGTVEGFWDRRRLEQVLENLLTNAIKYGAGRPIDVSLTTDGETAKLAVHDHGIGIAPEDRERIFTRFERAAPIRHYGGLGLGLYIAQRTVEAHGGVIRVRSEPGRGSTFEVELPLRWRLKAVPA